MTSRWPSGCIAFPLAFTTGGRHKASLFCWDGGESDWDGGANGDDYNDNDDYNDHYISKVKQ